MNSRVTLALLVVSVALPSAAWPVDPYLKLDGIGGNGETRDAQLAPGFVASFAIASDGTGIAEVVTRCLDDGLCEVVVANAVRIPAVQLAEREQGATQVLLNGAWQLRFNFRAAGEDCGDCMIQVPLVLRAASDGTLLAKLVDVSRVVRYLDGFETWQANRKVFLYPKNWLDPQSRDGTSDGAGPWVRLVPDGQATCVAPIDCAVPDQTFTKSDVESSWVCVPICTLCNPLDKTCGAAPPIP